VSVLWDRHSLKQAILTGVSHPKFIRAKNLVDKIKAGEVHLCRRSAMELGYLEAVPGEGWKLTPKGETFCREQMAVARNGNPCDKAQWETIERCMFTLMERTFDVVIYHPKKQSEAGRLFAFLHQEKDIDRLVEATLKVLMNDQDEVDSEEPEDMPVLDYDEAAEILSDEDETMEREEPLMVESDPRSMRDRILDEYIHMKEEGACGCTPESKLWKLLMEVVEQKTEFGGDKDYFNLPSHGEFDLSQPKEGDEEDIARYKAEMEAYNEYRLESMREGYSDAPNYEFHDMDIPMFEESRIESVSREHFSPEFTLELKNAYLTKLEELKGLDSPNKVMRDAFLTVVHTHGAGQFEEVGKALSA
jgi:hypothetical protein